MWRIIIFLFSNKHNKQEEKKNDSYILYRERKEKYSC